MAGQLHESYQAHDEIELPSEKSTGIVFAIVCAIIIYFFRSSSLIVAFFASLGLFFLISAYVKPSLLAPLNRAWFKFSILLSKVMNPIIMFLLFCVVILPAGLIMRIFRDPLTAKKNEGETYWIAQDDIDADASMKQQF